MLGLGLRKPVQEAEGCDFSPRPNLCEVLQTCLHQGVPWSQKQPPASCRFAPPAGCPGRKSAGWRSWDLLASMAASSFWPLPPFFQRPFSSSRVSSRCPPERKYSPLSMSPSTLWRCPTPQCPWRPGRQNGQCSGEAPDIRPGALQEGTSSSRTTGAPQTGQTSGSRYGSAPAGRLSNSTSRISGMISRLADFHRVANANVLSEMKSWLCRVALVTVVRQPDRADHCLRRQYPGATHLD